MCSWQGYRTIAVVTACLNSNGTPAFTFTEVEVTNDQYANGLVVDLVTERLRAEGYEEPFVLFDDLEAPAFLHSGVRQYLGVQEDADLPVIAFSEDR